MKIVLSQKIIDAKGKPFGYQNQYLVLDVEKNTVMNTKGEPLIILQDDPTQKKTLQDVMLASLLWDNPKEVKTPTEKLDDFRLYEKIRDAKLTMEVETKDITRIQELIGGVQTTIVHGQTFEMLEGKLLDKDLNKDGKVKKKGKAAEEDK